MNIVSSGLSAFMLREQSFSDFSFPRWQSVLAITLVGVLAGLDPRMTTPQPGMPKTAVMSQGMAIGFCVGLIWLCFLIGLGIARWWVKRGGRWDGEGDLFNLIAATWFLPDALAALVAILGGPDLLGLVLWMFSVWVAGNALSSAIPKVSLGYAIGGICISVVLMLVVMTVALVGVSIFLMGGLPPPQAGVALGGG